MNDAEHSYQLKLTTPGRRPLAEQPRVQVERGDAFPAVEDGLAVLQVGTAHREQDARVLGGVRVLEAAQHDAVRDGRGVELRHELLQLRERFRRREILRAQEILPVEEHVDVDERRHRRDAAVGLGHACAGAVGEAVPVEVGAGERGVLKELVQRMVPARLPEALLLDVERREEGVDPAGVRGHLDRQLLPRLNLRQRLPLHLHPGERLELRNVLFEHVDERMFGQEEKELLALKALPGEALSASRSPNEGADRGSGGREERATGGPSRHRRPPLMSSERLGQRVAGRNVGGWPAECQGRSLAAPSLPFLNRPVKLGHTCDAVNRPD